MIMTCKKVDRNAMIGTAIIVVACILIVFDPQAVRVGESFNPLYSALSILPSIPNALFFNYSANLSERISKYNLLLCQMGISTIVLLILAVNIDDAQFNSSDQGLFGFLDPKNVVMCLFFYSFLSGFWGLCGYIIALKYFSSIFVMNCLLMEPFASQLVSIFYEIDHAPGPMTWIGLVIIFFALNMVKKK